MGNHRFSIWTRRLIRSRTTSPSMGCHVHDEAKDDDDKERNGERDGEATPTHRKCQMRHKVLQMLHVHIGAKQACFAIGSKVCLHITRARLPRCVSSTHKSGARRHTFVPSNMFQSCWEQDEAGSSVSCPNGLISGRDHPDAGWNDVMTIWLLKLCNSDQQDVSMDDDQRAKQAERGDDMGHD